MLQLGPPSSVTAYARTLQSLVFADRPLTDAEAAGEATVDGDRHVAEHLLRCFPRTVRFTPQA